MEKERLLDKGYKGKGLTSWDSHILTHTLTFTFLLKALQPHSHTTKLLLTASQALQAWASGSSDAIHSSPAHPALGTLAAFLFLSVPRVLLLQSFYTGCFPWMLFCQKSSGLTPALSSAVCSKLLRERFLYIPSKILPTLPSLSSPFILFYFPAPHGLTAHMHLFVVYPLPPEYELKNMETVGLCSLLGLQHRGRLLAHSGGAALLNEWMWLNWEERELNIYQIST